MRSEDDVKTLVNKHEKLLLDAMEKGKQHKLRELCALTGMNYTSVSVYLKMFREIGWVKYDAKLSLYEIEPGFRYYTNETKDGEKRLSTNALTATFIQRETRPQHGEVKVMTWTKEEVDANERESTKHHKYLEYKRGVFVRNENYRHAEDSR